MTCHPCQLEIFAWLDSNPITILGRGIRIADNAAYDSTAAGIRDAQRSRHQRWAHIVRTQTALIRDICERAQELAA